MEQVLEVYQRPYDARRPVVCMDEQPKQLIEDSRPGLPVSPGQAEKVDHEYIRHGMCSVWMFVEPLAGWREVNVTGHRTSVDWARQVRDLVDAPRYADIAQVAESAAQWATARNERQTGIDWQFRTDNARAKLKYLYPKILN